MTAIRLIDTTLRDGSHAMGHRFTTGHVRDVVRVLDRAGVPVIEVSHGDGLGGSSLQCGFATAPELELIAEAANVAERARIAVMLVPGIGTARELEAAARHGATIARIATLCTEADLAERYLKRAADLGLEPVGFLMLAHLRPPHVLVEEARRMESYGARCVYLADSAGAMLPDDVRARVAALRDSIPVSIGFHAHNNFGLAIGNCLAAVEAGADHLDGSLRGLGAGSGNAPTELIAAVLDRMGLDLGLDVFELMDAAEFVVAPFMPFQPFPDRDSITLGYLGVYSTFLLHAKHAAERHGVDPRRILVELGRRQALVGQEDLPLEIALELAREQETGAAPVVG